MSAACSIATKILRLVFLPRPHWQSLQRSPDPLAVCKRGQHGGKWSRGGKGSEDGMGNKGEGKGICAVFIIS